MLCGKWVVGGKASWSSLVKKTNSSHSVRMVVWMLCDDAWRSKEDMLGLRKMLFFRQCRGLVVEAAWSKLSLVFVFLKK